MTAFFYIAGVTVTIVGILAAAVIVAVLIWVAVLHYPLTIEYQNTKRK
jgi:hypothetical protein